MGVVRGKVAAITGGGSGIGRAVALELVRRGAKVSLADRDATGLAESARLVAAVGGEAHTRVLDVTDLDDCRAWANEVIERFDVVNQLYNVAGIGPGRDFLISEVSDYDLVMRVNVWGTLNTCKAFLQHLIDSRDGHVINVSSLNGMIAFPGNGPYTVSKFAVRGFTETLRTEMLIAQHPVDVSCVYPAGVKTPIAKNAIAQAAAAGIKVSAADRSRALEFARTTLKVTPEKAARVIVDGVQAGKPRILVGRDAHFADILARVLPGTYPRLIARKARRAAKQ